jgi:hypothetical protein
MIKIAQMHPMNSGLVPRGPLDVLVTDHTRRFEAYREPYFGRVLPRGEIIFLPGRENGEVNDMFAGEAVVFERLKNDKDLDAVASCQFIMDDFVKRAAKNRRLAKL